MRNVALARVRWMGLAVLFPFGCTDAGETAKEPKDSSADAANALVRALSFAGGEPREGRMPRADDATVRLSFADTVSALEPGSAGLLPFDVENPDAASNGESAVLMQFEAQSDHIAVPVGESMSGAGELNFEYDLDDDVCALLCQKRFTIGLACAVEREDDTVGQHLEASIVLDCSERGDPELCGDRTGDEPEPDASTTTDASTAPNADAGMIDVGTGTMRDGGVPLPDGSVLPPFDAGGLLDAGIIAPDFPCGDGTMISGLRVCDGTPDCTNMLDEMVCSAGQFPCPDSSGTIQLTQLCDGTDDCADGYDETQACIPCMSGDDVYSPLQVCNQVEDCADGSDELPAMCNPMFPCDDGSMVPITAFCNGTEDCADGSDEPMGVCPQMI